ncbi:MAG: hypothetical protein JNL57_01690 [Bacteroidetes bacterium]|nr:hypothetical protein [Bacteroidota bacterium]
MRILLALGVLFLGSCCPTTDCVPLDDAVRVLFDTETQGKKFLPADLDTITLKRRGPQYFAETTVNWYFKDGLYRSDTGNIGMGFIPLPIHYTSDTLTLSTSSGKVYEITGYYVSVKENRSSAGCQKCPGLGSKECAVNGTLYSMLGNRDEESLPVKVAGGVLIFRNQ